MLIYISGMSCTGKTMLMNTLKEFCKEGLFQKIIGVKDNPVEFVTEFTRSVFREQAPAHLRYEDLISNPQECLVFHQRVAEALRLKLGRTAYNNPDRLFIFDRAPIDYRINLLLNYNTGDPEWMAELSSHYLAIDRMLADLPKGHFTFMTNPDSPMNRMEYDGFRPEKYAYRRVVEYQYFRLASKLPEVRILPDGVTDRLGFICRSIIKG